MTASGARSGDGGRPPLFLICRSPAGVRYAIWARPRGKMLGTGPIRTWITWVSFDLGLIQIVRRLIWRLVWHSQWTLTVVQADERNPWRHLAKERWPGPSDHWVRDRVGELAASIEGGDWTPGQDRPPVSAVKVMEPRTAKEEEMAWEHDHPWPPVASETGEG